MHAKIFRLILLAPPLASLALASCGAAKSSKVGAAGSSTTTSSVTQTATGAGGASNVVRASAGGVSATLTARGGHHPHVNRGWPISFTVTRSGRPARASVRYQYLFAGHVVAHRSFYRFTGHFKDVFLWPASAVGYPLTFRAVISSGAITLHLDYPVQVVR